MSTVRATFHRVYPPYVAGDVAGIGRALAERLRDRGFVTFEDPAAPGPDLDGLDRAGLVALARDRLGLADEPPAGVSDGDLRDALRAALAAPSGAAPGTPAASEGAPGWDGLDAMDRPHLEAFARTKCGMAAIDADMDDVELRRQIRAAAAATLNAGAAAPAGCPVAKRRR